MSRLLIALWASLAAAAALAADSVTVTEIDGSYEIVMTHDERSWIPVHPDKGFFPTLHYDLRLIARGSGRPAELDGQPARRYVLHEDVVELPTDCSHTGGELLLAPASGRLRLDVRLGAAYRSHHNHSGDYSGVVYRRAEIRNLLPADQLIDLDDTYVRARGQFADDGRHFVIGGTRHRVLDDCTPAPGQDVDILARVIHPNTRTPDPYLFILRKSGEPQRCCRFPR